MKIEGIKYTGSKDKIIPYILELIQPLKVKKVLDGFSNCKFFNSDLSKWNVSNNKDFGWMFTNCIKFNSDLSKWDVSNGITFGCMFYNCKSFDADLSGWNLKKMKEFYQFAVGTPIANHPEKLPKLKKSYK
jgi:surface protein